MVLISEIMGSFGLYQAWLCFLVLLSRFGVAFHQMAILFLAPPIEHYCSGVKGECCSNPEFDTTIFKTTIVTEWNLICGKSWLKDFNQTAFQFGVLIGSFLFGIASDKYGRRPMFIISVIIELLSGVIAAFLPDYWSFTVVRMIIGIAVGGVMVIAFVIVMEYVGRNIRDVVSVLFHIPFTMGHVLTAAFGYYIRDYKYFQLTISVANIILLIYICALPETPRWLLAMHKTDKAVRLLERVAKINKLPTDNIEDKIKEYQTEHRLTKTKASAIDLFRTPNLRRNILVMSFTWVTCSYCFYGMAQYISHLTGDIFINVVASGSVCLCGCILAIPLIIFTKRKTVVITSNAVCSLCILILAVVPEGKVSVAIGCIGVMCCYVVFVIIYLYCSEMFPTVVRNAALGICSMMARIGAMIAPFVADIGRYGKWCAPVAFGVFPIIAALLCLLLPETKDCELLMTIEEGENLGSKKSNQTDATNSRSAEN